MTSSPAPTAAPVPDGGEIAFVLGGGGVLGAHEVGMLRALVEAGVRPDVLVGTSVGALNGALFAADPSLATVSRLAEVWGNLAGTGVFGGGMFSRLGTLARSRTYLHDNAPLRRELDRLLGDRHIEDLAVRFQCVAASVERAAAHWFDRGPVVDAVLASAAVPGLLPPVQIDGEHFLDGGLVDSIPVGRALELGARRIYVLQVGRIEQPLTVPRRPWEVGLVAFEIARRHRFAEYLQRVPAGIEVHVLPTGQTAPPTGLAQLRYRDFSRAQARIERAYLASRDYLAADTATSALPAAGTAAGQPAAASEAASQ